MNAFLKDGIPTLTVCVMKDQPKKESVDVFDLSLDEWREAMNHYIEDDASE